MELEQLHYAKFMQFFEGHKTNYGEHKYNYNEEKGAKEKGSNKTVVNKLITIDNYKKHLNGKLGLGLIPINENNKCKFSVIDIDIYSKRLLQFVRAIDVNNFPLVPFRSKSGGLHIYIFYSQPVDAKDSIEIMKKMTSVLGIDLMVKKESNRTVEIFPKQSKINSDKVGNWINLPYYNFDNTAQYALSEGKQLSLADTLVLIQKRITDIDKAREFLDTILYSDAPPCLQTLNILNNLGENSGRNNYLFSFGVYFKKKDEEFYEQSLIDLNGSLNNPIADNELQATIVNSLRRKDYTYKCTESPCVDFCNKSICKKREFGVGKEGGYFSNLEYGKMTQIKTAKPYYEWEVRKKEEIDFIQLRFKDEDEIIKQDAFIRLCFRELHTLPIKLKQVEWFKLVNQHLQELEIKDVDDADDTSPIFMFYNLFFDFILNRAMASTRLQITAGRVFYDANTGEYWFTTKNLIKYLYVNKNFRQYDSQEIHGYLKDIGVTAKRIRVENGSQMRIYALPKQNISEQYKPTMDANDFEPDFLADEEEKF